MASAKAANKYAEDTDECFEYATSWAEVVNIHLDGQNYTEKRILKFLRNVKGGKALSCRLVADLLQDELERGE